MCDDPFGWAVAEPDLPLFAVPAGRQAGYLPSPGQLAQALSVFRPTVLLAVPRVLEKLIAAARDRASAAGHPRMFAAAEATAIAYSR